MGHDIRSRMVSYIRKLNSLKFKEDTTKVLRLEHFFVWLWKLNTSECRSEIPLKLWNLMLEKDIADYLDWSCEKQSITKG
jgi:hypothetical protein